MDTMTTYTTIYIESNNGYHVMCNTCGAIVVPGVRHDQWHAEIDRPFKLPAFKPEAFKPTLPVGAPHQLQVTALSSTSIVQGCHFASDKITVGAAGMLREVEITCTADHAPTPTPKLPSREVAVAELARVYSSTHGSFDTAMGAVVDRVLAYLKDGR